MKFSFTRKFIFWYIKYGLISIVMLIPSIIVNYIIVAFGILNLKGFWIFSSVVIGDIVGLIINFNISVTIMFKIPFIRDFYTKIQQEAKEMAKN